MQKYIIKSFKVVESDNLINRHRIYTKDERSGNYITPLLNNLPSGTRSLMDFLCLPNVIINSVERQSINTIIRELFTLGDRLDTIGIIQAIKIELGEVKLYSSTGFVTLENAIKYIEPMMVQPEIRRGPGRPKKVIESTELDLELLTIQKKIETQFGTRVIRLSKSLRKRKESPEEFLYNFFTKWNILNTDDSKVTKFDDDNSTQTDCGKRRSLGDIYMIMKYYYPNINIKDIIILLYRILPNKFGTTGFRTSKCNQIHKRVWYYSRNQTSQVASQDIDDEFGKRYQWYLTKVA